MTERRKFERMKIQLSGALDGGERGPGITTPRIAVLDLSLGGASCEIGKYMSPLTKVMLHLNFPGDEQEETAVCRGVVVWVTPEKESRQIPLYKIGILFTEISRDDREKLQHFLEGLLDRSPSPKD
jgi:c-di-GMP-binding flagellar brake protein YcgR